MRTLRGDRVRGVDIIDGDHPIRIAYAVEGSTWGPRVRARAVLDRLDATAVGTGEPRPPLDGYSYRRVRWTDPDCLDGFDVVLGDPGCVAMRPPGVRGIGVRIAGQSDHPRHGAGIPVDVEWDAEARPIHPWACDPLPTRVEAIRYLRGVTSSGAGESYRRSPAPDRLPLLVVLDQTSTRGVLAGVVVEHAVDEWDVVVLSGWGEDRWIIGADLLVCSAGWAQTVQARAAGIPYIAVEQSGADHWVRAHCSLAELPVVAANLAPVEADLDPESRAVVEDHVPDLLDLVESILTRTR